MKVKAYIFDIGGTVFDWNSALIAAITRVGGVSETDARTFALACRSEFMDAIGRVVRREEPWATSDDVLRRAVAQAARVAAIQLSDQAAAEVALAWRQMPAWSGAASAIRALRAQAVVAPLTILSWPMAVGSSRRNGIDWDGMICCDLLGIFKPDPQTYALAAEIMRLSPHEIAMVASHPSDLYAAAAAGWSTVYLLPHLQDPGEDYADERHLRSFDRVVDGFENLASTLAD